MNYDEIIKQIKVNCQIDKFKNIIESCNDKDKIMKSKDIINYFLLKETKDIDVEEYEHRVNDEIEMLAYRRPWNKMHEINKIIKMKEYIDQQITNNSINREEIKLILEELIKNKKLNSSKLVDYDEKNCVINSIKDLKNDNGIFFYKVK